MAGHAATKSAKDRLSEQAEARFQEPDRRPASSGTHTDILALQRAAGNQAVSQLLQTVTAANGVPPIVEAVLKSGSGQPIDPATREFMEARFGQDFRQVRVHTDASASVMARRVDASAVTLGDDVFFDTGQYRPDTPHGAYLVAHELAHVTQAQRAITGVSPATPREVEREAQAAGHAVIEGDSAMVLSAAESGHLLTAGKGETVPPSETSPVTTIIGWFDEHEIVAGAIQDLAEEMIEKAVPPAKFIILAAKLSKGFADGVENGIKQARIKLGYLDIEQEVLGKEEIGPREFAKIQHLRRWQKNNVDELKGVLIEGVIGAGKVALEELAEEITARIVESHLSKLGNAIGDFVGDMLTGDYIDAFDFISQATEDRVQETVGKATSAIAQAFAKSAASYAVKEGLTEKETREQLEEAGLPEEGTQEVATGMALDNVGQDVWQKINRVVSRLRTDRWKANYERFRSAYKKLVPLVEKAKKMNFLQRLFTKDDETLAEQIKASANEAYRALFSLDLDLFAALPPEEWVSLEADKAVIGKYL